MIAAAQRVSNQARTAFPIRRFQAEQVWGYALLVPYLVVFVALVVYPICYGFYIGANVESFTRIFSDPAYWKTVRNTIVFLVVAVNLKMFAALLISGFFIRAGLWVKCVALIFILPWAIPSFISILSFRWMLNAEWGMLNTAWFKLTGDLGVPWLLDTKLAMMWIIIVHIWKALPFWTLIMVAARLSIPKDLYEAANVDGATRLQKFRYVTWPGVATLYLTSTALSTIWSLGDFNSAYLLTAGGPGDSTHVLATLGIRYAFGQNEPGAGMASVITALPLLVPLVFFLLRWLKKQGAAA